MNAGGQRWRISIQVWTIAFSHAAVFGMLYVNVLDHIIHLAWMDVKLHVVPKLPNEQQVNPPWIDFRGTHSWYGLICKMTWYEEDAICIWVNHLQLSIEYLVCIWVDSVDWAWGIIMEDAEPEGESIISCERWTFMFVRPILEAWRRQGWDLWSFDCFGRRPPHQQTQSFVCHCIQRIFFIVNYQRQHPRWLPYTAIQLTPIRALGFSSPNLGIHKIQSRSWTFTANVCRAPFKISIVHR